MTGSILRLGDPVTGVHYDSLTPFCGIVKALYPGMVNVELRSGTVIASSYRHLRKVQP